MRSPVSHETTFCAHLMMCTRCGLRAAAFLVFSLLSVPMGWGQTSTRLEGSRPATDIVGDTGAPYENLFQPARVGGGNLSPKVGPGKGTIGLPLLRAPTYNLPLVERGFRPEDAEVKIGNLYVDVRDVSTSILLSDNVDASETARKGGVIGIMRLSTAVMYQVNDGIRLAVHGTLVYLPFKGKAGVNGFGISDPLDAEFGAEPVAHAQLAYDFLLGSWDVNMTDDFTANTANYLAGLTINQQFRGAEFEGADTAGRYSYRDSESGARNERSRSRSSRLAFEDMVYLNSVRIAASRMIPTVTRATLALEHENYWYQGQDKGSVSRRDTFIASLINEKKDVRFKPFVHYEASNDDAHRGLDHQARAGLRGPVTENLDFLGDAGYYWQTGRVNSHSSFLWRIRFDHTPGPLSGQALEYGQTVTRPERDLDEYIAYRYYHLLGPHLAGELFGERHRFEDLDNNNSGSTEYRAGVRLTYDLGKVADLRGTAYYTRVDNDAALRGNHDDLTARIEYIHRIGQTVQAEVTYQYYERNSSVAGDSYYENLFILTLRKSF